MRTCLPSNCKRYSAPMIVMALSLLQSVQEQHGIFENTEFVSIWLAFLVLIPVKRLILTPNWPNRKLKKLGSLAPRPSAYRRPTFAKGRRGASRLGPATVADKNANALWHRHSVSRL